MLLDYTPFRVRLCGRGDARAGELIGETAMRQLSIRNLLALAYLVALSACATITTASKTPPTSTTFGEYAEEQCTDTDRKPVYEGGKPWNACTRDVAQISYEYAQMAFNAYREGTAFQLGPNIKPLEYYIDPKSGFAYEVYQRSENNTPAEIIISYRGTNFDQWQDWIFGNIGRLQRAQALSAFDAVSGKYKLPTSLTGHSLGGALATQVSLCRDVHYNIVFDSSPRFSNRFCGPLRYVNHNISIVEFGEINKLLRIFGREPTQRYVSLNCLENGGATKQHSMRKLAACLTNIATLDGDVEAIASKKRNAIPDILEKKGGA